MKPYQHHIHIRKEYLKFSAAHLTLFPDGTHERLHGHNYTTEVSFGLREIEFNKMLPFSAVKMAIQQICQAWDEKVLVPTQNPFLTLNTKNGEEIEFNIGKKRYVLPKEDVVLLGLDNITTETLALEACRRLIESLRGNPEFKLIQSIAFRVEESPGQGASCHWQAP